MSCSSRLDIEEEASSLLDLALDWTGATKLDI